MDTKTTNHKIDYDMNKFYVFLFTFTMQFLCVLGSWAQPAGFQAMIDEARSYSQQKEYEKSSECYEKAINMLKGTEAESLIPSVRSFIAINNMHLGVAALKSKDYDLARKLFDKAVEDAKEGSDAQKMALRWLGRLYSTQSQNLRIEGRDTQQALQFSLEAEKFFNKANAVDLLLKEQLVRASILTDLSKDDEAEILLLSIISANKDQNHEVKGFIEGNALYCLGGIELRSERFSQAIQHLEQAYNLCKAVGDKNAEVYARLAAKKLSILYSGQIPDESKFALWKQRCDELKSE